MESIYNISSMRRKILNNVTSLNIIQMDGYGVSVLLAKVNTSVDEQVFRVNVDEISFTFTGELKETLRYGSAQVSANIGRDFRCTSQALEHFLKG